MKHYTSLVSLDLAEKLKAAGMHSLRDARMEGWLNSGNNITYAEVFDWFESRSIGIGINHHWSGIVYQGYDWRVCKFNKSITPYFDTAYGTWHEAANAAIEKALELIKEK